MISGLKFRILDRQSCMLLKLYDKILLWRLPYTVQYKYSAAPSTADTLNYGIMYYTKKLTILHRAMEVLNIHTTTQHQRLGRARQAWSSCLIGGSSICVGGTWHPVLYTYMWLFLNVFRFSYKAYNQISVNCTKP